MEFVSTFKTGLGMGAVMATELGVCRVYLPHDCTRRSLIRDGLDRMSPSELTERVSSMLMQYFKGEQQQFEIIPVAIEMPGEFRKRVLGLIRTIPAGTVKSYGEVACLVGSPGAARAVGGAVASNPVPIIIPCHRVISRNGNLTGFTAPGGLVMKKYLLQMEGIEFKGEHICQGK
jgi:methylated-DNA-[protein]-cysteine S-methyltransferase